MAGAAVLTVLSGLAMWAGAVVSGSDELSVAAALRAVLNTASVTVLVIGIGLFSRVRRRAAPDGGSPGVGRGDRLRADAPGAALSWPGWVVDLSPFSHLAYVPAEPLAVTPAVAMAMIGCVAGACGVVAFARRDLTGA